MSANEIDLLEEFREELSPRFIGGCGHRIEISPELVKVLYETVCDKLASLGEVA